MHRLIHAALLIFALSACSAARTESDPSIDQQVIFRSGEGGYHTYRIPAIITTAKGTVLAFCEGRKASTSDAGDIDLLLRRSADNGNTWGPVQVVVDDGESTCGNPCPIVDRATGDVVLLITKNGRDDKEHLIQAGEAPPRTAWVLRSSDDGATWSPPQDISASVRRPEFRWYATGPGHGIQLAGGRMIAPCDHSIGPKPEDLSSHVIYSDDGGHTWALGGMLPGRTDESIAVELDQNTLYINMRNNFGLNQRAIARSNDQGLTFGPISHDAALAEPVCQASALLLASATPTAPAQVLFSNPASTKRENMTLRLSIDAAQTWPRAKILWPGPAAYSDLALLPDGRIACLYERGDARPYETIALARVAVGDIGAAAP